MEGDNKNNSVGCNGCGCLLTLFWIISFCFVCDILVKSCNSGSIWEGAVTVAKEYVNVADSIWNK